jgi:oxygen-independent coproporphyrinogen-3 oxidase
MDDIYGDVIRKYIENGLLERGDDRIALTERGLDVSNVVMEEFLL